MKNANFSNKTDWNISDKLKVFGRYSQFRTTLDQENYTPNNSRGDAERQRRHHELAQHRGRHGLHAVADARF